MPLSVLRTATLQDVDPVLEFWVSAAENDSWPADSRGALAALIGRDSSALTLASETGWIVGTVIAGRDGWRCHLYRLAVAPEHRGRGVARMLIEAAETRFAALGGSRADAMVLDANMGAHATWTAFGYASQPEWSRWVKPL